MQAFSLRVGKKNWLIKNRTEPNGSVQFLCSVFLPPKNRMSNIIKVVKPIGSVFKKNTEKLNRISNKPKWNKQT